MYKYTLSLLVGLLFICGCTNRAYLPAEPKNIVINGWVLKTFNYEGCEYLCLGQGLTHKGNCNNPIHKTIKQ